MKNMNTSESVGTFNPRTYFEDIGAWPISKKGAHSSAVSYGIGFLLSLALTFFAYHVVTEHELGMTMTLGIIVALAVFQFVVQMICFLHMDVTTASRDRLIVLGFAGVIVAILVVGSLWVMNNLNNRMMPTTDQMEQYMSDQTGI
jgi:cytochrome o ubiquinol oxidase operon protein cyoD